MINVFSPKIGISDIISVLKTLIKNEISGTSPIVGEFEEQIAKKFNRKHAIAVSNGSVALDLAFQSLGLNDDDEVIIPSFTIISCLSAVVRTGATPIFCDVDRNTWNMSLRDIEKLVTKKTKAILIVHFAGLACDMDKILFLTKKYNLHLIEDCAHAIEGQFKKKNLGTFGTFGCFSFYATKNLSIGEGGMLITNNKKLYDRARILSLHGMDKAAWNRYGKSGYRHYDVSEVGYKYNLMDLLSAIGIEQLKKLEKNYKIRENLWKTYANNFAKKGFVFPYNWSKTKIKHSYHLFNLYLEKKRDGISRDEAISELHKKKIGVGIHYKAIPEHSIYKKLFKWNINNYPNAKKIGRQTISLPLSPSLKKLEILKVVKSINKITCK